MAYTGSCACGAVRVEIASPALAARQCWCSHCQKLAGGGPMHNAFFRTDDIILTGELASNSYIADSGTEIRWYFCPACATHVFAGADIRPHMRAVRIGIFDRPHDLKPEMAIWTQEAPAWAAIDPALERYPAAPLPPPALPQS
ncbi:GFA family protein [Sphingopyxis indica]|uniref:GFA family protein n=1 Tax=Sphingopyxis indica TaxID=436663 RepID=UPI0029394D97|nr:GFA family protein [Sphingopyxis indica]WOF42372.1 GFA family protein [Sphingopyxis indica]